MENRDNINWKKLFQKVASFLGILIAIFALIVSIIQLWFSKPKPDFNISVSPIWGTVHQSGSIQTSIEIESINGYEYPVSLTVDDLPADILIDFYPKYGKASPRYKSKMSINIGLKVQIGDYVITVKGNGSDGKEHICKYNLTVTVIPPLPPNEAYIIYNDLGIAPGDIQIWSGADWGLERPVLINGNYPLKDVPEGNNCFAIASGTGTGNYAGWGVFLGIFENHNIKTPHTININEYQNLQFWVKSPINLKVEIQENDRQGNKSSPCIISKYGWQSSLSNNWQKITIPRSSFRDVDFKHIWCPFMITGMGGRITYFVDDVSWIP